MNRTAMQGHGAAIAVEQMQLDVSNVNNVNPRSPSGVLHGGPVHPVAGNTGETMLDRFASKAMQSLLARGDITDSNALARQSYAIAKSMVQEMKKVKGV